MRLPYELLWLSFAALDFSISVTMPRPNSAAFSSLRGLTSLEKDHSALTTVTQPDKYFHESKFNSHYDGRFASQEVPSEKHVFYLQLLLKSYTEAMRRIGIRTWIMHGTLLGWWWNRRIMPWDSDLDVMVDEKSIVKLGSWWNMTVHTFKGVELGLESEEGDKERKYLLEVNPHFTNTSTRDKNNVIDARWIDTSTGLYIDLTTIHVAPVPSSSSPFAENDNDDHDDDVELYTKDQHWYSYNQIFPLRQSTFESVTVNIPYAYEALLLEEYGPKALTSTYYRGYAFDAEKKEWAFVDPTTQMRMEMGDTGKKDSSKRKKPPRNAKIPVTI